MSLSSTLRVELADFDELYGKSIKLKRLLISTLREEESSPTANQVQVMKDMKLKNSKGSVDISGITAERLKFADKSQGTTCTDRDN